MTEFNRYLENEDATLALGVALAHGLMPGMVVYLIGELGAGKTTLARGVLRGLGHKGKVKSPTFTLVEAYEVSRLYLYHFDFYRFTGQENPRELEEAGFREYFNPQSVCLVEWPDKAAGLPPADLRILMQVAGLAEPGRNAQIFAETEAGGHCLKSLQV